MNSAMNIGRSGLQAATLLVRTSASNIVNMKSTGSPNLSSAEGRNASPYFAKVATLETNGTGGVKARVALKSPPTQNLYAPYDTNADENGFAAYPNVSLAEEIVNLKMAEIAYKANAKVISSAAEMEDTLLEAFSPKDA